MSHDLRTLAASYEITAQTYMKRPASSRKLDILAHARKLDQKNRTALLLALCSQGFTSSDAQQIAKFCPAS